MSHTNTPLKLVVPLLVIALFVVTVSGCGGGREQTVTTLTDTGSAVRPASVERADAFPANGQQYLGDMDDDGQASVGDAIKILRIVVGLDDDDPRADANQNDSTDVGDVILVLRCVVGLDTWPISPARDLTGTWKTPIPVVYYTFNIWGERAMKVTANIKLDLQQSGNTVTGTSTLTPIKQEPIAEMPIPDPGGPLTISGGTVSSTNFTFTVNSWTPSGTGPIERWDFSFTTDLMEGTVSNLDTEFYFGRDSDTNAIHLVRQ